MTADLPLSAAAPSASTGASGGKPSIAGMPQQTLLVNGCPAVLQTSLHRSTSALSLQLPAPPGQDALRALWTQTLLAGSEGTKRFLEQALTRGINVTLDKRGNRLLLNLDGPAGQEADLLRTAMSLLQHPVMDPNTFERNRQNLIQSAQAQLQDPATPLYERMVQRLYGESHPYARSLQESLAALQRLSLADVMGWHQQMMADPRNIRIAMVSALPPEPQQDILNQGIQQSGWRGGGFGPFQPMNLVPPAQHNFVGRSKPILLPNESIERAIVYRGWRAPAISDPDYPAFCVMRKLMEDSGGLFFRRMRIDAGLVYSFKQQYKSLQSAAHYQFSAHIDGDKLAKSLDVLRSVTDELVHQTVPPRDLQRAKNRVLFEAKSQTETPSQVSDFNSQWLGCDLAPLSLREFETLIQRITPQDVRRVAARMFHPASGFEVTGITAPQAVLEKLPTGHARTADG